MQASSLFLPSSPSRLLTIFGYALCQCVMGAFFLFCLVLLACLVRSPYPVFSPRPMTPEIPTVTVRRHDSSETLTESLAPVFQSTETLSGARAPVFRSSDPLYAAIPDATTAHASSAPDSRSGS